MPIRPLSRLEARVLGVLVEKALTVPDSYPLSLNALTLGCNQKTARDPVLNASEGEVQAAVDALRGMDLATESSGSRVTRHAHNMGRALGVPSQSVALLAVLMLRGPQTASELRANSERLHRFADLSSVDGFLEELAERAAEKGGPLAQKLPKAPGAREARWVHLLSGPPDPQWLVARSEGDSPRATATVDADALATLQADHAALREEVATLRSMVERISAELGIRPG